VFLLVQAGCATYSPHPLTPAGVEEALAVPPEDALRVQAEQLRNPLLPAIPLDLTDGLSPDEAAVLAVLVNPALRAKRDRLALSSAQLVQAGILPNPMLDFSVDPVTGGKTQGTYTGYGFGVGWDLQSLLTRAPRVAAARSLVISVQLDVAWQEWQTAQAAKKAVYDLLALRGQVAKALEVDERLRRNLAIVQCAVDAHQKTLLDLSAAEAASRQGRATVLGLQRAARQQELILSQALGLPPEREVALGPFELPSGLDLPPAEELQMGLESRRLDLMALRRGYDSQEETVRAAILAQFPQVTLGFHQASDTSNVQTTGFGVTLGLPIFDRNQGVIAVERATRQELFDEYVARVFDARSAVAQSLANIGLITGELAGAQQAVPSLERLVGAYGTAVDQGNADILSYYQAHNDLTQKELDILKLQQELMDNKVALEMATGLFLPDPIPARLGAEKGRP
jgi:outer membrane protein TolC